MPGKQANPLVAVAVDPALKGMSRLADRLDGVPVLPGRHSLMTVLSEVRERSNDGTRAPVVAVLPSNHPALVAVAARHADRVVLYHTNQVKLPSWKQIVLRAALSAVDCTVVPDQASLESAVRLGADPNRISLANEPQLGARLLEPKRHDTWGGLVEASASLALDAAERIGFIRAAELLAPNKGVNVVNYHRVLPLDELRAYTRPQMAIAAPLFLAQLEEIAKVRSFTRVEETREPSAHGKVAITFDDGYEDNFRVALPLLQRFSTPACIFIVTNLIGQPQALWWDRVGVALFAYWRAGAEQSLPASVPRRARALAGATSFEEARQIITDVLSELNGADEEERNQVIEDVEAMVPGMRTPRTMLSWEEIEEMRRLGITFGSHTRNHVTLNQVPVEVAREELFGSQHDLEAKLGTAAHRLAALPRGELGALNEDELRGFGFEGVMTSKSEVNRPRSSSIFIHRRDGRHLSLRGRHHPAKLRLELTGLVDRFRG